VTLRLRCGVSVGTAPGLTSVPGLVTALQRYMAKNSASSTAAESGVSSTLTDRFRPVLIEPPPIGCRDVGDEPRPQQAGQYSTAPPATMSA
jgi:hypothetical protein